MVRLNFSSRFFWLVAAVTCLSLGRAFVSDAAAQTPSADQIQMFQNLADPATVGKVASAGLYRRRNVPAAQADQTQALKPSSGYDLFSGEPSTFVPTTDVPVPAEYVAEPGDTIEAQLVGNTKGRYALAVGCGGRINLPEIGPRGEAAL